MTTKMIDQEPEVGADVDSSRPSLEADYRNFLNSIMVIFSIT